jgi:hypothetical protein
VADLAALVRNRQDAIRAEFARRLRDVAPEYYAVDATDFKQAGWSALTVVVDGALSVLESWEVPTGLPRELEGESRAAVRNGLPWQTLDRTYHLTHQVIWSALLSELTQTRWSREDPRVLQVASDLLFRYFDHMTTAASQVYAEAETEARGESDRRTAQLVNQIFSGAVVQDNELGYRLSQHHTAVVAWGVDAREAIMALGRTLQAETLTVPTGDGHVWGWWGTADAVNLLTTVPPPTAGERQVTMMVGSALSGRSGFLTSHLQAKAVASLVARRLYPDVAGVTTYDQVSLRAVALENETAARVFVEHELGRLTAAADDRADELRETLLRYVDAGLNAGRTATLLGVAERTVRHRLSRLEQLLGQDFRTRLPQLVLAIQLYDSQRLQRGRDAG